LKGCEDISTDVYPVLCAQVEQFEDPPHRRGDQEQANIFSPVSREQGCARSPKDQAIHGETVTQPQREEAPMSARPRQDPIENPKDKHENQPNQAMQGDFVFFVFDIQVSCHPPSLH
jgi:hypothetical protein